MWLCLCTQYGSELKGIRKIQTELKIPHLIYYLWITTVENVPF